MPCGDVDGRVHVSVGGKTAGRATEVGLALARLAVHIPARRAPLARVRGLDLLDPAGGPSAPSGLPAGPSRTRRSPGSARLSAGRSGLGPGPSPLPSESCS